MVNGKDYLGTDCTCCTPWNDQTINVTQIKCTSPYRISPIIYNEIIWPTNVDTELSRQQATSIIKKCIESEKMRLIPIWHRRNDKDMCKSFADKINLTGDSYIFCCYEDYRDLPINHSNKPHNLLKMVSDQISHLGATAKYKIAPQDLILCDIPLELGKRDNNEWISEEAERIIDYLVAQQLIEKHYEYNIIKSTGGPTLYHNMDDDWHKISITMNGWGELSRNPIKPTNDVFIAMDFSTWENVGEKQIRETLKDHIKAACESLGYNANIVDQDHTGNITDKIISQINRSKFVICDFTHSNCGAYYEAGYARALGKPVYHIVREDHFKEDKLHFDIKQINCRSWSKPEDVKEILKNWISANESTLK